MTDLTRRVRRVIARVPLLESFARLVLETIRVCMRYRVTGLASEAGFFALLSLPPLILGLFGGVGYLPGVFGPDVVAQVRTAVESYAARFLTPDVISSTIGPTVDDALRGGRIDLISVGFALSLWSGSRAVNVFLDTVSIMYGQSGVRGIVRSRVLSILLYVAALLVGIVTIPLVLVGPTLLAQWLPDRFDALVLGLYWPVISVVTVANLATLFHIATPRRSPWLRDVPGAVLTLGIWLLASVVVRTWIAQALGGTSIFGPLSASIVLLTWLYMLAIAVLIGAAFNAAIRALWPAPEEVSLARQVAGGIRDWRRRRKARRTTGPGVDPSAAEDAPGEGQLGLAGIVEAARGPMTPVGRTRIAWWRGSSAPREPQGPEIPDVDAVAASGLENPRRIG